MKTRVLLSMLLLLCTAISFAQNKVQLVGTWKLISGKITSGDSTSTYGEKTDNAMKIVTPSHFAVVSKNVSTDSLQHAVAGTVEMDDKNYTERIEYCSFQNMVGKTAKFTYRVESDKWYVKGGIENVMTLEEVWQRVKSQ